MPDPRPWTEAQRDAMTAVGRSLLVSAAAGSGKTSVLAERCVRLVCDGPDRCGVADLLVVTFTENAATEMKDRIGRGLARRAAESPGDEHVARQLALLERAAIGTLHGFCSRLLRQHFQRLSLDPDFRILDADEVSLMKAAVARELVDDGYDRPDADVFCALVDAYADGQDDRLVGQIVRAHELLCSVVDPAAWRAEAAGRLAEGIDRPLFDGELGKQLKRGVERDVDGVRRDLATSAATIKRLGGFDGYLQHLRGLYAMTNHWLDVLRSHGWDAMVDVTTDVDVPKLKPVANSVPGKAEAKAAVDAANKAVKEGDWRGRLRFSEAQWRDGLAATRPHADLLMGLVAEFGERYDTAKHDARGLDFADLERFALAALRMPDVARGYHRQFQHVLVDEYQDINAVQDAILSRVSHEAAVAAGDRSLAANLFCVGDVKQSIYRFRLAEPGQFLARREAYAKLDSHGRVIDLSANFRSRGPLLAAVNAVFYRTMTADAVDIEYDETQRLVPGRTFPPAGEGPTFAGAPIELHVLPAKPAAATDADEQADDGEADLDRTDREAVMVGRRILEMVGATGEPATHVADGETTRPVRFGDVVLLLRSMRYKGDQFAAVLRGMGVPVHAESTTGYFEATEVNDVLAVLKVLDNAKQDVPLAAVLRSPMAGVPDAEEALAAIRSAYAAADPPVPFHDAVARYGRDRDDGLARRLRALYKQLETWRQVGRQKPVADLIWQLYADTGYLAFCAGLPNGEQRQANLLELHERATQFATFRRQSVGGFIGFLDRLREQSDLGQASVASEAEDVVRIMTVHRSKGLEFPVVFVPDLGKRINLRDGEGPILLDRRAGIGLQVVDEARQVRYPSLAWTIVRQRVRQQSLAEEVRVLYVALTRAKEHLVLVGTCDEKRPEKWREQWAGHEGPMPTAAILAAGSMLDWVGPVAAMEPAAVALHVHGADEVAGWTAAVGGREPPLTPSQLRFAKLDPLDPAPERTPGAQAVISRLGTPYEFADVTTREAAVAVTATARSGTARIESVESTVGGAATEASLNRPTFMAGDRKPTAVDRGTATHAALQFVDFASAVPVGEQVDAMVAAGRIAPETAAVVDRGAIEWFLAGDVGRRVAAAWPRVRREVPVIFTTAVAGQDAMDHSMVRGRIDLLVPTGGGGWLVVDYKTDRVGLADVDVRAAAYARQVGQYRRAVQRITAAADVEVVLVFLSARQTRAISSANTLAN